KRRCPGRKDAVRGEGGRQYQGSRGCTSSSPRRGERSWSFFSPERAARKGDKGLTGNRPVTHLSVPFSGWWHGRGAARSVHSPRHDSVDTNHDLGGRG